ncbi:unnamed protein product, partial [Didymodactylos carnosus]
MKCENQTLHRSSAGEQ